jgi:Rps23 Pro-64 3,4-dihydroxylase Tpa1-like proline 4-hydroxylase
MYNQARAHQPTLSLLLTFVQMNISKCIDFSQFNLKLSTNINEIFEWRLYHCKEVPQQGRGRPTCPLVKSFAFEIVAPAEVSLSPYP